jgi:hypothetical protein
MERETIIMDGYKFHRYPNAKRASDKHYFKGWINIYGYWRKVSLHRYIWEKVNGEIPKGFLVHHDNGIFSDNRIENLCLVSHSKHLADHYKNYSQSFKDEKTKLLIEKAMPKAVEWHKSKEGQEWHKQNTNKLIYTEEYSQVCIGYQIFVKNLFGVRANVNSNIRQEKIEKRGNIMKKEFVKHVERVLLHINIIRIDFVRGVVHLKVN